MKEDYMCPPSASNEASSGKSNGSTDDRHVAPPECPRTPKCRLDPRGCADPECVEARYIERTTRELHAITRAAFRRGGEDDLVAKPALTGAIERIVFRHLQADILSAWDYSGPIAESIAGLIVKGVIEPTLAAAATAAVGVEFHDPEDDDWERGYVTGRHAAADAIRSLKKPDSGLPDPENTTFPRSAESTTEGTNNSSNKSV